jgi:hypothetical protein
VVRTRARYCGTLNANSLLQTKRFEMRMPDAPKWACSPARRGAAHMGRNVTASADRVWMDGALYARFAKPQ